MLLLAPILAPAAAAVLAAVLGWRRVTAVATAVAAAAILGCGIALAVAIGDSDARYAVGHLLRADALSLVMLIVIGAVGVLATWAGIGYIDTELVHGHTTRRGAQGYGVLVPAFLAAMVLAVEANNLGVMWVAIEATTIVTAFLVGHRRTRAAWEATWKYVVICSVGIALAFLGTVLLYFANRHAGATAAHALDFDSLLAHAGGLDHPVVRMAAGLLLIGYGAKVGLVPFHTWLADAHSQAPAPVSALMSGVLLPVAFVALLRVKAVVDLSLGPGFLRAGLLIVGLLTMLVAAGLLIGQRDFKRMLAYSSMENMGLLAIAAAGGSRLAIAALLLHVVGHGLGKAVLFLAAGSLQASHDSTAIANVRGVLRQSPLVGGAFAVGTAVVLGLPPFALFASELSIAQALGAAHLAWALGPALLLIVIAFAAVAFHVSRMLLGSAAADAPVITAPRTVAAALVAGMAASLALGITAGPLGELLHTAARTLGAGP
jgi:hydrogenase-4 component F